jgi:hypothetical protein
MSEPRQLTALETTYFLLSHPLIAEQITKTKVAIETGVYDWTQTLPSWFFAMIPPWGTQVQDSDYGTVTVYFGTDGTLYLTANSPVLADINKPAYVPPPVKCKDGSDSILGVCPEDFSFAYVIGFGLLAYVGYQILSKKKAA